MGVRERLRTLRKVFGNVEPESFQIGEEAAGMTPARPFSPGEPIGPYDGYSRHPRTREIVTGYNINARPRAHERVPFDTLRGLIEAYDVAQMAIWHRIDSIRSLEWSLVAADGFEGDVTDAIATAMSVLESPDRGESDFSAWLAAYLYDTLAYDAGALYRIRNRAGQSVGLRTVDGTTLAPLQDYWGNVPKFPAEAYVQYANGLPWNWLTTRDLVYKPFRKINRSPYGQAPLETILLNANTDLRFQAFFLQHFTEGNIPAAFASAPETWTPQQIEMFQTYWDGFILGDQAAKAQIKWIPGGSKIEFTQDREFSDAFSLHLMRKTLAAYHVVPADMGFTENVNKSSGETQSDVQHRVGDVPLAKHVSGIITGFLQNDLHLPVKHQFDFGEEQDDRLQTAQADKLYVEMGAVSSSDIRQLRYGLTEANGYVVPRYIFTTRGGPIPLGALDSVAGEIDPGTAAPALNAARPHQVFRPVQGVIPVPPIEAPPLAVQEFGPAALPPAPAPVGKEGAPTAGITAATGIYSYDLAGRGHSTSPADDEDDEDHGADTTTVTKAADAEITAFRRHAKQTRRPGRKWRDFQFGDVIDSTTAHRLNDDGRLAWRKAAGQVAVAGLAVQAADTGRVLMLQRALADDDPAGGCLEFPGGHIEGSESPAEAAVREWTEETGLDMPNGEFTGEWTSANGIYRGFVYTVASEDLLDIFERDWTSNPDDPDGDAVEVVAWFDPDHLADNPAIRPELATDISGVLDALDNNVAKAAGPKGDAPAKGAAHWPGWDHDQKAADHWSPIIAGVLAGVLTATGARLIAAGFLATRDQDADDDRKTLIAAALAYLLMQRLDLAEPLTEQLAGVYTDGYLIGTASAEAVLNNERVDLGGWKPGDTGTAETLIAENGKSAGLDTLLDEAAETAAGIAETRIGDMARALADATLAGATADEAGQAIRGALADASRADAVATTEITRASGAGALSTYLQQGVTLGRWATEGDNRVCPRCLANAAAGPVPIGQPYPSGDVSPPCHTRDRCAILPA